MLEINNTVDGSLDKAIQASGKLKDVPGFLQAYMLKGDFFRNNKKVDGTKITADKDDISLQNYVAQLAELDKTQQAAVMRMTKMSKETKNVAKSMLEGTAAGSSLSGAIMDARLQAQGFSEEDSRLALTQAGLMDTAGNYLVVLKDLKTATGNSVEETLAHALSCQQLAGAVKNTEMTEKELASVVVSETISAQAQQIKSTWAQKLAQDALNLSLQLGKQLLVSFVVGAAVKFVQWLSSIKTKTEKLTDTLNDAHEAIDSAKSDIEGIQNQIDELNNKIKEAGGNKISDIVDPSEQTRLENTIRALERQLALKKEIQEAAEKEAREAAENLYNTKGETVYRNQETGEYDFTMGISSESDGGKAANNVEALKYYSAMLDEYTDKQRNATIIYGEDSAEAKAAEDQKDFAIDKVNEYSESVSNMQQDLDATSDAYNNCTAAISAATDALAYSNGTINISGTEISNLADKVKDLDDKSGSYYKTVSTNPRYTQYGNIDNTNRGEIRWTPENMEKYSDFVAENDIKEGSYSTVMGANDEFNGMQIAFSPMLQTEDGVVPLTEDEIYGYIEEVVDKASEMKGGATAENILAVDKEGLIEDVAGDSVKVSGMIAAVEGQIKNGAVLTAADIAAIAGETAEDIQNEFGQTSSYIGYSMHDVQSAIAAGGKDCKTAIDTIKKELPSLNADTLPDFIMNNETLNVSEDVKKAFDSLWEAMHAAGLGDSIEDCEEFAKALERLGYIAADADAAASAAASDAATKFEEASKRIDNLQAAYKTMSSAVKEYNKNGFISFDTLQSLTELEPQYLVALQNRHGQLEINNEAVKKLANSEITLYRVSMLNNKAQGILATTSIDKANEILSIATTDINDTKAMLAQATAEASKAAYEKYGNSPEYARIYHAIQLQYDQALQLDEMWQKLGEQSVTDLFPDDSKTSSSTKAASSALDAWSTLSSAMEEYNKQGSISYNTMKSLMGLEEKYTACLKKQGNELTIDANKFRAMIETELVTLTAQKDKTEKTTATINQYNQILQYLDQNARNGVISLNELRDAIEGVGTSLDKAQEKMSGTKSAFGTIHDILNDDNPSGALTSDSVESVIDLIQEHGELKDILFDESGNLQINEESLKAATIQLLENEKAATKDAAIQAVLQKSIDDLSNGVISLTDYLKGLNTELDDIDKKLDKFQSGFSDITDIVDEYNTYGKLTQDSYQKLLRLDPQYLACLEKEGDQLKFNADAYRMLYAEQVNQYAMMAKTKTQRDVYASMIGDIFGFTPEQLEQYKAAISGYNDLVQDYIAQGIDHYGNVSNINRDKLEWTKENMEKYHDFVEEQNEEYPGSIAEGDYSTILGASDTIDGLEIAYTPMLQTDDGLIPLTQDQLWNYLDKVIDGAYESDGGFNADNLLKIDAEGFEQEINGSIVRVHGMIAGVQGMIVNGVETTATDIAAIAGATEDELQERFGQTSQFVNKDMHTLQSNATDAKDRTGELKDILNDMGIDGAKALELLEKHFGDADAAAQRFETTLSNIKSLLTDLIGVFEKANDTKSNELKLWADALNDEIDERIKKLNKQKDALSKENDEQERAIELTKAQDALARAQAQHTARVYGANGYEWEANSSDVRSAQEDIDDKRREWRNADAEKAIDDEIEKLNELKDEYAKAIENIGTSLDDYNKKQIYAAQIQKMTFDQMSGNLTNFKDVVLSNMKDIQLATNVNNVISNIESLLSTLETLNDVYTWITSKGTSTDGGGLSGLVTNVGKFAEAVSEKGLKAAVDDSVKYIYTSFEETLLSSDNSVVKLFSKAWAAVKDGTSAFFSDTGLGQVIASGASQIGGIISNIGGAFTGGGAALGGTIEGVVTGASAGLTAGGVATAIPIVGALLVGVNSLVQEVQDVHADNKKLWADPYKTVGEKIVGSLGNILYHLTPVEDWNLSLQYAKKAAEGEGIWDKLENGAKAIYYGCGLGRHIDNLIKLVKKIFKIQDDEAKDNDSETTTKDVSSNKNLSVNGTETTTTTKKKMLSDPDSSMVVEEPQGPSTIQWVVNPVGSGVDTLTGYDYNNKENNSLGQNIAHAVTHPIETAWNAAGNVVDWVFGKKKKHATGLKSAKSSYLANVDERGSELMVRNPAAGRYTYLETGDGVVPADITSRLFEMGGNPDAWFDKQMAKYGAASNIQSRNTDNRTISVGDIHVNNPVGNADDLARELVQRLPSAIDQRMNKR